MSSFHFVSYVVVWLGRDDWTGGRDVGAVVIEGLCCVAPE